MDFKTEAICYELVEHPPLLTKWTDFSGIGTGDFSTTDSPQRLYSVFIQKVTELRQKRAHVGDSSKMDLGTQSIYYVSVVYLLHDGELPKSETSFSQNVLGHKKGMFTSLWAANRSLCLIPKMSYLSRL
ncbi:hypothetical protein CEXT_769191 [Caerostris extrusa]|uniref:Uncharacterized protein n=1 Tax=Caerostris extrusa TaxID=172846 RepID=A0AAV4X9G3_CAEEX|nr:hypothetical protein CEXT_769191 [Caerostris extrusa]